MPASTWLDACGYSAGMSYGIPPEPEPRPRRTVVGALVTALVSLIIIVLIVWGFGLLAGGDDDGTPEPAPRSAAFHR